MKPINTEQDVSERLAALVSTDPRLKQVLATAGPVPLRRRAADFEGLAQIITGQQVSVASAAAIFQRLQSVVTPFTWQRLSTLRDEDLAAAGLSRPKIRTMRAVVAACEAGLDLQALAHAPAETAHADLCAIKGIGRWTADIFLLFCAGHPDVFPSGDLALQVAVAGALGLEKRPALKELDAIAMDWAPNRAVAARLFWSWYRTQKQGRETLPV